MRKDIVVMTPTLNRAVYEWKAFLSRCSTIIKKANRPSLSIELLNGQKIYFKGETEGQRALRGLHADVVMIDEFVIAVAESEETETWNGIHAQITAPKGTFERIFNDADDDNDI